MYEEEEATDPWSWRCDGVRTRPARHQAAKERVRGNRRGRPDNRWERVTGRRRPVPARLLALLRRRERQRDQHPGRWRWLAEVVLAKEAGGSARQHGAASMSCLRVRLARQEREKAFVVIGINTSFSSKK
ncbi:hypothetical protein VPH35_110759 [Triticum aestivum]